MLNVILLNMKECILPYHVVYFPYFLVCLPYHMSYLPYLMVYLSCLVAHLPYHTTCASVSANGIERIFSGYLKVAYFHTIKGTPTAPTYGIPVYHTIRHTFRTTWHTYHTVCTVVVRILPMSGRVTFVATRR